MRSCRSLLARVLPPALPRPHHLQRHLLPAAPSTKHRRRLAAWPTKSLAEESAVAGNEDADDPTAAARVHFRRRGTSLPMTDNIGAVAPSRQGVCR